MLTRSITDLQLPLALDRLREILRDNGVTRARLYGSLARGEGTPSSDIDMVVEMAPGRDITDLLNLRQSIEDASGRTADITTAINIHFLPFIEPDLVEILET